MIKSCLINLAFFNIQCRKINLLVSTTFSYSNRNFWAYKINSIQKDIKIGIKEMARGWGEVLVYKYEDQGLDPQHSYKGQMWWCTIITSVLWVSCLASQSCQINEKTLSQKKKK